MADISRYRGGAQKRKPRGTKQVAGSTASGLTRQRVEETRARNTSQSTEGEAPSRRLVLNVDSGSMEEQLPLEYETEEAARQRRAAQRREANRDGLRLNPDAEEAVSYRRRFKNGGSIRKGK